MAEFPEEEVCRRPLSDAPVEPLPSGLIPARVRLEGTGASVEPIDPERHAAELFAASHGVPGGEAPSRRRAPTRIPGTVLVSRTVF